MVSLYQAYGIFNTVADTWRHFFQDPGRVEWPAHIPMTKATIRAMDTVQAYSSQHLDLEVQWFYIATFLLHSTIRCHLLEYVKHVEYTFLQHILLSWIFLARVT